MAARAARRVDWKTRVQTGFIPWDAEGFLDAFRAWQELITAAMRRARTTREGRVRFHLPTQQMGRYFVNRYGPAQGTAHFVRWVKVGEFLATHMERLQAEGLVHVAADGSLDFSGDLIASLCAVRYRPAASAGRPGRRPASDGVGRRRAASAIALPDVLRRVARARAKGSRAGSRR